MGIMNLLKSNWHGRVGETVGASWKGKNTIRTYAKPTYTNTPAQQQIRNVFGEMTKFVALFSADLKGITSLNTKGMSIRNAIIHNNKDQFQTAAFDPSLLRISRGGLPNVALIAPTVPAGLATFDATWTPSTATTVSAKAQMIVVVVDYVNQRGYVGHALQSTGTISIPGPFEANAVLDVYYYIVDQRAGTKVGNVSTYVTITAPAS